MIVWGGASSAQGILNTGGRYCAQAGAPTPTPTPTATGTPTPCISDTWTTTSTANVPDARYLHTAVWTGSEMIVWGGFADVGLITNTGGRYNPSTDTWIDTSTTNAPIAREQHTAVWTGSEMIVWGGDGNTYLNTGARYNPTHRQLDGHQHHQRTRSPRPAHGSVDRQ